MKITKNVCDFCNDTEAETKEISIFSHRETDLAGDTESVYESFDFCLSCLTYRFDTLASVLGDVQRSSLLYELKLKRNK